jgi:hypothetical protein
MKVLTENGCHINTFFTDCKFIYDNKKDELIIEWKDFAYSADKSEISPCVIRDKVREIKDK